MVGQAIELVILPLTLIVLYKGIIETDLDFKTYEWTWPFTPLGALFLLLATTCSLAGIRNCRSGSGDETSEMVHIAFGCLVTVYGIRLLFGCILATPEASLGYLDDDSFWKEWYFWAGLIQRWVTESLLLFILYHYGRAMRDERVLSRVRWVIAFLVAEVLIQLVIVTGMLDGRQEQIASHFGVEEVWVGMLFAAPMLVVRVAVVLLLLGVCSGALAARRATRDKDE